MTGVQTCALPIYSICLQFLAKILDPHCDLRDGEIAGKFNLFSVDQINAELNNMFAQSGMLTVKRKLQMHLKPEEMQEFNDTVWKYLANKSGLDKNTKNYDLMIELIDAVHKFNKLATEELKEHGGLSRGADPETWGTRHRVNATARQDPKGFVKALVDHALKQHADRNELSIVTAEALGWLEIHRDTHTDNIVGITIKDTAPLRVKKGFMDWTEAKALFGSNSLRHIDGDHYMKMYLKALTSSEDYTPGWKKLYKDRGNEYSAIQRTMEIAKDRYLGIEDGDSKTGKPKSEILSGRNFNEERILEHDEIARNPELAKYFDKNIYDLVLEQIRGPLTEARMSNHLSQFFGSKIDRKSTRLNSSHIPLSRMPSSA